MLVITDIWSATSIVAMDRYNRGHGLALLASLRNETGAS
jgi:hypothetical protein